ncbi:glycosyltransferase family 39 protein [Candidatus Parcubacteria bacterium]|nr:glycosyltransferase family 39 protein [Candidatus Parcubacteria bacterium]
MKLNKKIIILAVIVMFVQSVAFFGLKILDSRTGDLDGDKTYAFPTQGQDSPEFVKLGHNLATEGRFTLDGTTPETFRTIGYPLILAFMEKTLGSSVATIFLQIILSGGIFFLIWNIGRNFLTENWAIAAALVFGLSPSAIFHSVVLLSEIPFIFFFLFSINLIFFAHDRRREIFLGGIALGIATLIRPISLYLPLIFAIFLTFKYWKLGKKFIASRLLLMVLGFILVIFPYYVRNYKETGVWGISSITTYNLARYNIREFLAEKFGTGSPESLNYNKAIDSIPVERLRTLEGVRDLIPIYSPVLKSHLVSYAVFHVVETLKFFFSSNIRYLGTQIQIGAVQKFLGLNSSSPDLLHELRAGHILEALKALKDQALITLDRLLTVVIILLATGTIFIKKNRYNIFLLLSLIAYFAVLTGPVSIPRYRLPVEGLIIILAMVSLQSLRKYRNAFSYS